MDIWAEGLLAGRCAAAVPVQVPLRCQQATGVGAVGVAGVQGLTEAHYGLTTAYVAFRRAAGGAGWGGTEGLAERAAERAAGRRCARMSSGQGGRVGVSTDGKAAAVWCLSCACERRAKCQCLCLEGALSYERTATGSCREPALESQTSDLTRRDHDAELRAGPGSEPQPQLTLIHRTSAHTSADTTTTTTSSASTSNTTSASTTATTSEAPPPPPPAQAPPQQPPPHPPWPPRRPCP
jgi:hypothetical protein